MPPQIPEPWTRSGRTFRGASIMGFEIGATKARSVRVSNNCDSKQQLRTITIIIIMRMKSDQS